MNLEERAEKILSSMTLQEKIGQVTQMPLIIKNLEDSLQMIRKYRPGSLILADSANAGNEKQHAVYLNQLNAIQRVAAEELPGGIPLLFGRDVIHGHRVSFPVPLTMTASFDFDLIEKCYDMIRAEAHNDGVNWAFSPMLDFCHDPRWGRIVEGPGEDPYLGEQYAAAVVRGFQTEDFSKEGSIAACAKHYAGYGLSEGGRDYTHTEISDYQLQNNILPAFRSAVKNGIATVMASFNDINGVPASGNRYLLDDVLRDQLGFDGFVISDWEGIIQMAAFQGYCSSKAEAALKAIEAGVDMDMAAMSYYESIEKLIAEGKLEESVLDRAVRRILLVKLRMGLFEHPYIQPEPYDLKKHVSTAKTLAEESIVLLKNKNHVLPLKKYGTVQLCGPFADSAYDLVGTWSLDWDVSLVHTVLDRIISDYPGVKIMRGWDFHSPYRIQTSSADAIVVVMGERSAVTGEGNSVADVSIPAEQLHEVRELKKTGLPIIGVFCFARPVAFGEDDDLFDAILYAGHGGTMASDAIVSVLFGDAEPGGRLPFTLPYSGNQIPLFYNHLPGSRPVNGYYGDIRPFCNYADCTGRPNYPFGHGLSYTEFTLSAPTCAENVKTTAALEKGEKYQVEIEVENVGDRTGTVVVQLYVHDLCAEIMRPLRVLRGFQRVSLIKGLSRKLLFEIGKEDLGYYLPDGTFTLEAGDFDIYIGENCLTKEKLTLHLQ